ncbi:MAG: hypothetical protein KID00_16085 [Clostridium argentinense]|uniref:competence protein CoiA family protein n=1 Tax=uncultured Clostridium sp. TaxID=59620 RepID=UPI001D990B92|nr:competence protein CoiA family protein [uncultured Clostridium sp.]MBS5825337.1 hypothetical protein [Clostridium argentinense]MDU1348363.1 competence protein CoiA family protein [Clostridium argentinense]
MNIKLPFAIRGKRVVHISELSEDERGLKCNCICPNCNERVVAKLGEINIHHFAHYNKECKTNIETVLHLFVKDVLSKYKKVKIPSIILEYREDYTKLSDFNSLDKISINKMYEKIVEEQVVEFDEVKLEKRFNDIVPDVVLYKNNYPLIIEIAVTHFINEYKKRKIERKGISTLEINMSKINFYAYDKEELEKIIIYDLECKSWVYNRKLEQEKEKIIYNNLKILEKSNYEKLFRINRIKNNFQRENYSKKLKIYAKNIYNNELLLEILKKLNVNLKSMPIFLNIKVVGELSFECDRRIWQSCIFEKFINREKNKIIKTQDILIWIKEKSHLPLNKDLIYTKDLSEVKVPDLNDCILNYLYNLEKYKIIKRVSKESGYYSKFQIIYNPLEKNNIYNRSDYIRFRKFYNHNYGILDKYAECKICNEFTNDWIIYYGDGTCKCRKCNAEN